MRYFIDYEVVVREREIVEANSFEEAREKWRDMAIDGELCCIENDEGEMMEFC